MKKKKPAVTNETIAAMLEGVSSHLRETNAALRAIAPAVPSQREMPEPTIVSGTVNYNLNRIANSMELRNKMFADHIQEMQLLAIKRANLPWWKRVI